MFHVDLSVTGPVVIIGAKPKAALPAVPASVVIAAKSATEVAAEYRRRYGSHIIALAPGIELNRERNTQLSITSAKPDEVVILGAGDIKDPTSFVRRDMQLTDAAITVHSFYERNWLLLEPLGWRRYALAVHTLRIRGIIRALGYVIPDFLTGMDMTWLSRSTGVNAMLYASARYPRASQVIATGVGLTAGGHFDGKGIFTTKSAESDRLTMQYWHKENRKRLYTTDDVMHALGGVPRWEGGVFYYGS